MDTQQLIAFFAVAENQSFSLAAEELNLTQSAISKRVSLLEQQLGTSLFDRAGRTIDLTEAGHLLLPRAKEILELVDDTQQLVIQQHKKVSGNLRLATSHHIGLHRLPPVLKAFTDQFPDVRLKLQFMDSEKAIQSVAQGYFDLAVLTLPENLDLEAKTALQHHAIWQDPMQVVVTVNHQLAKHQSISLASLADFPAILPDVSTFTTRLIKRHFDEQKVKLDMAMTTNHLDAIKMMVSIGLGWSVLPESLIDDSLHALSIRKIKLIRQLGCIHHRHKTLSNASRAMLKLLKAT